jgi:uncharacterized protein
MTRTRAELVQSLKGLARFASTVHGPAHWARVHRFGGLLADHAQLPAAARTCVELFAWLHDLAREDDWGGNKHAIDGASQLDRFLGALGEALAEEQRETLRAAIRHHSDGMVAREAFDAGLLPRTSWPGDLVTLTVGCCWDADRLDLPRVGILPRAELMSTPAWHVVQTLSARIHHVDESEADEPC